MADIQDYTLFLGDADWDLHLDDNGDIMTREGPIAVAQNVANLIRLFKDDAYFAADRGLPHFAVDLPKRPPPPLLRSWIIRLATSVPGVADATVEDLLFDPATKEYSGNIKLKLETGETGNVAF